MQLLQICSYYITDVFYTIFFQELNHVGISNKAYVFANKNWKKEGKQFDDAIVSYCFDSFDRMFFHRKHRKVWKDFQQKVEMEGIDCVHAHSLFSNGYIAYLAKKKYGIPYIVTVRYPDVFTFFKWMVHLRTLGKEILREAEAVIFLSERTLQSMEAYLPEAEREMVRKKAHIIPNGIQRFWLENRPVCGKTHQKDDVLRLLFVGRLNKNKNPEVLLRTCEILKERDIPVELTFVGGMEEKKYETVLSACDFVKVYPKCGKEELLQHYRNADVFVMLSHKETFGLVYAEAMSQGLPVIYSRGQGFDGQFAEGVVGYACDSSDPKEAADLIERILNDYESISSRCIREAEKFSWEKIVTEIAALYDHTQKERK